MNQVLPTPGFRHQMNRSEQSTYGPWAILELQSEWILNAGTHVSTLHTSYLNVQHCATSRKIPGSIPGVAGDFSLESDNSMCPGVDSASKNEYQDNPGGKGGRCVRLTTYHLHVLTVKKSGGLNLLEPCGPVQACNGTALPLPFT